MTRAAPRVIVVGGGPAGVATALFLAAAAPELTDRLLVLERERYPREKFCAGAVGARADRALARIGVTVDVPSAPMSGLAVRAMGRTRVVREPDVGRVVRRLEFDDALARIARGRGIQVRDGVRVTDVRPDDSGVLVRTSDGDLRADVVIGADGVSGIVRRALGVPASPHVAQALEVDTAPVATDLPRDVLLFDLSDRTLPGYYWDFPTVVDGRDMVCRGVYYLKSRGGPPVEIERVLAAELVKRGLELSAHRKKRYAERGFHAPVAVSRPRVLLVGEAAGIDPVTGEGIAQAVQYGEAAGAYLARKLRDGDLSFSDFGTWLGRSSVGRDLGIRCRTLDLAYGERRPSVERFLLDTPDFLRVGLQHFGGRRWSRLAVARAAAGAIRRTTASLCGLDALSTVVAPELP